MSDASPQTPFEQMGGRLVVRAVVDRFYDLMDHDPAYGALRAMHAQDLGPMRESLAAFLSGWLGGPRDWFDANPGKCVMSAHARMAINPVTAGQWTGAMARAMTDAGAPPQIADAINQAFARMASAMAGRQAADETA